VVAGRHDDRLHPISGTPASDVLAGTVVRDVICGLGGNDRISGGGAKDEIEGGPWSCAAAVTGFTAARATTSSAQPTTALATSPMGGPGRDRGFFDKKLDTRRSIERICRRSC